MKSIFNQQDTDELISRINSLSPASKAQWGKMNVGQMIAHCNVPYAYTFEPEKFSKPNFLKKFLLQKIVKKYVLRPEPYKRNSRTAPEFIITDERNFEAEKERLIRNIQKTRQLGEQHFEGLENISFGRMSASEWNTMFYKHLNHHLLQFGV
ncbi:DUF1569 domain-containing protein [Flavihumibacter solisilvae]|uniref:DUF1569 domain-containing protein n=1 Tax=Flavihumibacter solisilvae TaxID=1349421 RepID=A0A0C1IHD7_9BACT|nr:DUF1569 domain-containing protein [Flavihumibacter solisilvae]KIC93610.1 hypothetical protein OI18_17475 [Flavihumibacter solisilvae]